MVALAPETVTLKSLVFACEEVLVSVGETRTGWVVIVEGVESKETTVCKVGKNKREGQVLVGFAAETSDLVEHAKTKLEKKNLEIIVANEVGGSDSGFGADTVRAHLVRRDGTVLDQPFQTKRELARALFDEIVTFSQG